jgi:hypothetical protein
LREIPNPLKEDTKIVGELSTEFVCRELGNTQRVKKETKADKKTQELQNRHWVLQKSST